MDRVIVNTLLIKEVEEIDENTAVEIMSEPNLDGRELSEILNAHFCKSIINTETNEPLQLSNKVVMAGIRNRFNQLANLNNGENGVQ